MQKTAFFVFLVFVHLLPLHADDAIMPEQHVLELTLPFGFGIANQYWNSGSKWENASGPRIASTGLEMEYGAVSWLSAFARWAPGFNMFSKMDGENYGRFNDIVLGLRGGILGPGSPLAALQTEDMRLTTALQIKTPLPSRKESAGETDLHLWGTGLKVSWDYIFVPQFYLNAAAEAFYYPRQRAENPDLGGDGRIELPMDVKFELEPRGVFAVGDGSLVLSAGIPFTCQVYAESKFDGANLENERRVFSIGAFFGTAFMTEVPFDLKLLYAAPVAGRNGFAFHTVTLSGTVYLRLLPKKN
jgi:hypothetical protein